MTQNELQKAKSIKNFISSSKMDIISDDNKAIRVSKTIQAISKDEKLSNDKKQNNNNNDKNCGIGNYTNPFSINNPTCNNYDNNKTNNSYCNAFLPAAAINKKDSNNCYNIMFFNNYEKEKQELNQSKQNFEKDNISKLNNQSAFVLYRHQQELQKKSAFFNFNQNSSLLNKKNKVSNASFILNRENSVIYNKTKSILNSSSILNVNPIIVIDLNNNFTNANLVNKNFNKAGNGKISAIQQQQITLNTNRNNASKIENANQQIKQDRVIISQASNMQIENLQQIFQITEQIDVAPNNNNQHEIQFTLGNQSNLRLLTFNPKNHNNQSLNSNSIADGFQTNPCSVFSLNPPAQILTNDNNNIFPYIEQNRHLNNYANLPINSNAFSVLNSAYVNYNNNINNYALLRNMAAIKNANIKYNYADNFDQNNNFVFNQQQGLQSIALNNNLYNFDNNMMNLNLLQIPNVSQVNNDNNNNIKSYNDSFQNNNLNPLQIAIANSKQTGINQPLNYPNLKEINKSLFIDTKLCNEYFEEQTQTSQSENTNLTNNSIKITCSNNHNQKQTLLQTISSNIHRRITQKDKPNISLNQQNLSKISLPNPFTNSFLIKQIKSSPQILCEYFPEFLACLKSEEQQLKYNFQLRKHHPEVSEKMRLILLSWLIEVHRKFRLLGETLYLTVHFIDSCLHSKCEVTWNKSNFQLLGISSLLLACKYEEIYFPNISDFRSITDRAFSVDQILQCEFQICKILDYFVLTCYPIRFLELYRFVFDLNDAEFFFCKLILEVSLMDSRFLEFDRSLVALTAVFVMGRTVSQKFAAFEPLFYAEVGNKKNEFRECARLVGTHLDNSLELDSFKIIYERYLNNMTNLKE
jgi:hypothetical protein